MLTVNTNTTSLITQMNLSRSNNLVKTSIERLSTGFKINRASDDAANMSISKNMECQISGTDVAIDNSQQAVNLLQTADGALDNMQSNLLRIRDLTVQALNGTYSDEEKAMIQGEIDQLMSETYKQRNNTMFNQIRIFGEIENKPVVYLTAEEAIAQGYTCIYNESEFESMVDEEGNITGKYCLMGNIDFLQVSSWGDVTLAEGAELNGNGHSINNLTINSTTNSDMKGLIGRNKGTIKNLNLNNVSIDKNDYYIGGLASSNSGRIDNCSLSGSIKGGNYTGGLVGDNRGTITNSSSSATVTGNGYITGGLVGDNRGTITNSSSSGNVTGTINQIGGLVGVNGGTIIDCSSSGTVTGPSSTGGLVGSCNGTIDKSYATGDVNGTVEPGGLVGRVYEGSISNSYSLGNVSGNNRVGGFIGYLNKGTILTSYTTGTVEGTGSNVGGFVGENGWNSSSKGNINNSYTTSELDFYGKNTSGTISNCYGTTTQTGVTAHDESWFEDGSNLSFLGDKFDTSTIPPEIIGNVRPPQPVPPVPPVPPTPTTTEVVFQIGANSGEENTITIDTGFSLNNLTADVTTRDAADKTLVDIDKELDHISSFRSTIGAMQNRLESVAQSLSTRKNNMESSLSTIKDTDFAYETSKLVQNQILQNVASSLLAQANSNPEIALTLLK